MKRLFSWLLCLAMLFSLAPTAAMADAASPANASLAPGMYASWNDNTQTVGEKIPLSEVGGEPGYIVPKSSEDTEPVAYFVCNGDTNVSFANGLSSSREWGLNDESLKVYELTPHEYYRSYGELIVSGENEAVYRVQFTGQVPIEPSEPEGTAMYTDCNDGKLTGKLKYPDVTDYTGDDEHWSWGYVVPESANGVAYFECDEGWSCGEKLRPNDKSSLNVKQVSGTGIYEITPGDDYGSCGEFRLENGNGGGMSIIVVFSGYDPDVITPAHEVGDGETAVDLGPDGYNPVLFTFRGQTYYMAVSMPGDGYPMGYTGIGATSDMVEDVSFEISFWTYTSTGYDRVDNDTLLALNEAMTYADINIYAVTGVPTIAEIVPAELKSGYANVWKWRFNQFNSGAWELRAEVTLDGKQIIARAQMGYTVQPAVVTDSSDAATVDSVNAWLNAQNPEAFEETTYKVNLNPGNYYGTIVIPDGMFVQITGAMGAKGANLTTLHGGIKFGADATGSVFSLNMVGAGKSSRSSGSEPNYALYGENSGSTYGNVNFSGYYHAIHSAGGFAAFGPGIGYGVGSVFKDNHVGIYTDASDGSRNFNSMMMESTFRNNDYALWFESFGEYAPRSYTVGNCKFIDNAVDIYNRSGRNIFVPGNYMIHDGTLRLAADTGESIYSWGRNFVSAYPLAANEECTDMLYETDLRTIVLSNSEGAGWLIPIRAIVGRMVDLIYNGDEYDIRLASVYFPETASSSNGGASTLSNAREEQTFDPSIGYSSTDTEIRITLNEIPAGFAPIVTVYFDGWGSAVVSHGGERLASSFSDGEVSFTAVDGGEYVITRAAAAVAPSVPSVRPEEPEEGPDEPETPAAPSFADVPEDSYYAGAVEWAVEAGITEGTGEDTFSPEADCTRAEVITFLWRAALCPEACGGAQFDDVDAGEYYSEAVAWAVSEGITTGVSDSSFSPDAAVTRAQFVVMLWRAAGEPEAAVTGRFDDVDPGAYYAEAVAWALEIGITDGTGEDSFSPDAVCSRAQIVTFMYRAAAM